MTINWITNSRPVKEALSRADAHWLRMRADAAGLPLADKVVAYRRADEVRATAYQTVRDNAAAIMAEGC